MFQKELTLINQTNHNVYFVIIAVLKILVIILNHSFVMVFMMCWLMTAYELRNIAMLNVKGVDYRCILWGISKDKHYTKNEVFHQGFLHFLCSGSS